MNGMTPNCLDDFLFSNHTDKHTLELILSRKLPFPLGARLASCYTAHGVLAKQHLRSCCLNCWKQHIQALGISVLELDKCLRQNPAIPKQRYFAVAVDSAVLLSSKLSVTSTTVCLCGISPSMITLFWMKLSD